MTTTLPYGSWPSPITADLVVAGSVSLGGPAWQPAAAGERFAGWLWWSELRPEEQGRVQLVRRAIGTDGTPSGEAHDVLPAGYAARTRVHEYGGGASWLGGSPWPGTVFFANWADQRLYRYTVGDDAPVALSPEARERHGLRYADGVVTPDGRFTICVQEAHDPAWPEARNTIVAFPAGGVDAEPTALVAGPDFVSSPRVSPDGTRLCWIQWNHPNMPWDDTELWEAELHTGADGIALHAPTSVAAAHGTSYLQPSYDDDGRLWVITDTTGYWNVWALDRASGALVPRVETPHDIGEPPWVFGQSSYAVTPLGTTVVVTRDGVDHLAQVADAGQAGAPLVGADPAGHDDLTSYSGITRCSPGLLACIVAGPAREPEVVVLREPVTAGVPIGPPIVVRPARDLGLDPGWCSAPTHVTFASGDGASAHALYYPPTNPDHEGPDGERPPLLVLSHGGPTSAARPQLQLSLQYWTSRGFGVVDVNYRGSTGYGRAFRDALRGQWGIHDVDDCIAAARDLSSSGAVDGDRLLIRGGSAGGYTTLCALTWHDLFAAGASLYGVADLEALARDTHKFEARYLDSLVAPYPEGRAIYLERSPIHFTDRLRTPLIVFQGLEDEIVPPAQSEMMVDALRANGVPHAYLAFEGEQHGFRQAANIKRVLEAELYFYGVVVGFEPAGRIEPVEIENSR